MIVNLSAKISNYMSLEISYQGVSLAEEDILKKVIGQLNKDLILSGIEYKFDVNSEKDAFIDAMLIFLETTLSENENRLFSFLYQVDVDQKYIYSKDLMPQENLLRLILNRELQKVVLKRLYSSGTSS